MKWSLLIVLNICFSLSLFAQKIHFTDTSNVWKELTPEYNAPLPDILYYNTYSFIKDTAIDSVDYKWFSFDDGYCANCSDFVREDTVLRKVYMRAESGDSDIVLMDYNLNVGDTFITDTFSTNRFVVLRIDSTLINTVWHKIWYFSGSLHGAFYFSDTICVIEGLGCIQDPTYMLWDLSHCIECEAPYMYCFSNKGGTPPVSPKVEWLDNTTSCSTYPSLSVTELYTIKDKISIYPNPAATELTIIATNKISSIAITNLLGQTIYAHTYDKEQVQIDITDLPLGVYMVKINGSEVRKFVKQ